MVLQNIIIQKLSNIHLRGFLHPDNELKNQLSLSPSFQGCAGHVGLYKQKFSVERIVQVYAHCTQHLL